MTFLRLRTLLAAAFLLTLALAGCNSSSSTSVYEEYPNVAVTDFSLKADSKVTGLDSTYFSIDLEHGVIFNADSLRKGTPINKLVANIKYSNLVESAIIKMTGGTTRTGEIDYKENPTDSIDFTGDVTLTLTANGGAMSRSYRLKVNVHNAEPDRLVWSSLENTSLTNLVGEAREIKTVKEGDRALMLTLNSNGEYALYSSDKIGNSHSLLLSPSDFNGVSPRIETFTAGNGRGYFLDQTGNLYSFDLNGGSPSPTGTKWTTLIGPYEGSVLGVSEANGVRHFECYPSETISQEVPEDFPLDGLSNLVTLVNKWTSTPVAFFIGGAAADTSLSNATWAFDGSNWVKLGKGGIPALRDAALLKYYNYRPSAAGTSMIEYEVWLMMGGQLADGTYNRTVYISYNNGVDWQPGSTLLQLPEAIPGMRGFDAIVMDEELSASIASGWKKAPMKLPFEVSGDDISWECPYIHLIGGTLSDGSLNRTIWRGVLSRLTFTPII